MTDDPLRTASDGIYLNLDVLTRDSQEFSQRWRTNPVQLANHLRVAARSLCPEHNEAFKIVEEITANYGNSDDDGLPFTIRRWE